MRLAVGMMLVLALVLQVLAVSATGPCDVADIVPLDDTAHVVGLYGMAPVLGITNFIRYYQRHWGVGHALEVHCIGAKTGEEPFNLLGCNPDGVWRPTGYPPKPRINLNCTTVPSPSRVACHPSQLFASAEDQRRYRIGQMPANVFVAAIDPTPPANPNSVSFTLSLSCADGGPQWRRTFACGRTVWTPPTSEVAACHVCEWGEWAAWGPCRAKQCGKGWRFFVRKRVQPKDGLGICVGKERQRRPCERMEGCDCQCRPV